MGRLRTTPGFHEKQRNQHRAFFSSIHRATVTDTASASTKGTVSAEIEGTDFQLTNMLAPLMSLSIPPQGRNTDGTVNKDDDNGAKAAWGRYIPQVGDVLLVGFDTNGEPYALGYHALYYQALDVKDKEAEARGGIGWGVESGVKLEPGDWDFMSRRGSRLMLTDKVHLSSGPHSFILDQSTGTATLGTTLSITQYGEASKESQGAVQRFLLPTDTSETAIYGIFGSIAQESTNVIKRGSLVTPGGIEMARTSMGEVIDELTYLPMVPVITYPALNTIVGTGTRIFRSVKDPLGATELFTEVVDDLGNYGVSATLSTGFQWNTPLATWTVLNAITDWTSSGKFGVTAGAALDLTAGADFGVTAGASIGLTAGVDFGVTAVNATITATQVALGGSGASGFLVNGTLFMAALTVFLGAVAAQTAATDPASTMAALKTTGSAATALLPLLNTFLSTVTKTV